MEEEEKKKRRKGQRTTPNLAPLERLDVSIPLLPSIVREVVESPKTPAPPRK